VSAALPISETAWQEQVIDLAHTLGWRHMFVRRSIGKGRKWTTATNVPGWPDLTLWSEGRTRVIFAELKSESGKPSPDQIAVLRSLTNAGCETAIWRPSDLYHVALVLNGRARAEIDWEVWA
jgi:hypothetical protein